MLKKTQLNNLSVEAARYHVQLKTHNDHHLFAQSQNCAAPVSTSDCCQTKEQKRSSTALLAQVAADELLLAAKQSGFIVTQWTILPHELHIVLSLPAMLGSSHNRIRNSFAGRLRDRATPQSKPRALTTFVATFKAASAKRINLLRNQPGAPVWQSSYSEQLIADTTTLKRIQNKLHDMNNAVLASL